MNCPLISFKAISRHTQRWKGKLSDTVRNTFPYQALLIWYAGDLEDVLAELVKRAGGAASMLGFLGAGKFGGLDIKAG